MKLFCKYSGVSIVECSSLDSLGLPASKFLRVGEHPAFSYSMQDLCLMAHHKASWSLSARQRHLLAVAILRATGTVQINYPITTQALPDELLCALFPALQTIAQRIATKPTQWRALVPKLARVEVRADNQTSIDWSGYIKEVLLPNTTLLEFRPTTEPKAHSKLEDEITLERELKEQLTKYRADVKRFAYTATMGKWVLKQLIPQLPQLPSPEELQLALDIITLKPERLQSKVREIKELRKQIVQHLVAKRGDVDTLQPLHHDTQQARSFIALTLGHLDAKLDFISALTDIFGGTAVKVPAHLPGALPVQYTVRKILPAQPNPYAEPVAPVAPVTEERIANNPALARIAALRAKYTGV